MTDVFAERRSRVLNQLGGDGALLLAAAPELVVGRDTELRYVIDADLYYLTGYTEPDAVMLLDPQSRAPFTMFVRDRDPQREQWTGGRAGVAGAQERFGAQAAHPIGELSARLPGLLKDVATIFARATGRPDFDPLLPNLLAQGRLTRARTGRGPHVLRDPGDILDDMRLIKDETEIEILRQAIRITTDSFMEALPRVRAGMGEWQVEALIEHGFRARAASGPAFPTIAASGSNATTLHYIDNRDALQAGDLLLVDAGARYQMYCGDISRTVPVSGRFSARQREVYEVVVAAQAAALAAITPGAAVDDVHDVARRALLDGLIALNIVSDAQRHDEAVLKRYFPHRTSHWLGLDVHDVGAYVRPHAPMLLEPGMVLTIEPGLYLPDERIGIRIEDDVLVTATGKEVLSGTLPADVADIEGMFA